MEKKTVNQLFVVKMYVSNAVKPILVEVFPNTEIGLRDAENYSEIDLNTLIDLVSVTTYKVGAKEPVDIRGLKHDLFQVCNDVDLVEHCIDVVTELERYQNV